MDVRGATGKTWISRSLLGFRFLPGKLENHSHFVHYHGAAVTSLKEVPLHIAVTITAVEGNRSFRRRLMEMGLVPGTAVRVVNVAPLGDPLEIEVRASRLSIRKAEAALIVVRR
jgi:ferrous iron transport protein A